MKFLSRLIGDVDLHLIRILQSEVKLPVVNGGVVLLSTLINSWWVHRSMQRQNTVSRRKCCSLIIIPVKQLFI